MKKLLLLFFLFALHLISVAQTSVYHPFPTTIAIWNNLGHTNTHFELRRDTVMNGHAYKQIHGIWNGDTALINPLSGYTGALREENKKVYWHSGIDTTEYILYDFTLVAGDSMRFYKDQVGNPIYFTRYVASVDSVLVLDGHYRKRFNLIPGYNCIIPDTVVEGIGSINWMGLFNPFQNDMCTCGFEYDGVLCFRENDTTRYFRHEGGCSSCFCNMALGIDEANALGEPEVYPNPFTNETTITVDKELKNATLIVYNAIGQQVKQVINISGTTMRLQRDDLPAGIYFVSLLENNAVLTTGKLLITD